MELKEGMYIRTDDGIITKIIDNRDNVIIKTDDYTTHLRSKVTKASNNIIDLIEPGDYVNGYPVVEITNHQILGKIVCTKSPCDWNINEQKIKSIVTKEQFSQMEYKVGE